MSDREDASFCRPRLFDRDDGERRDDVGLIVEALNERVEQAMAEGNADAVAHADELRRRVAEAADADYSDVVPGSTPQEGAA